MSQCSECGTELVPCNCDNVDCWQMYETGKQAMGYPAHSPQAGSCNRALKARIDLAERKLSIALAGLKLLAPHQHGCGQLARATLATIEAEK